MEDKERKKSVIFIASVNLKDDGVFYGAAFTLIPDSVPRYGH
jgi:hypothetical protein